jgi:DNA-binding response OmpR family regulator
MMPKLNGYELAKRLRAEKIRTPILMLTAKDSVPDIVRGLDLRAGDQMTKPFCFGELLARLRTLQRRVLATEETKLRVGDLVLDPASCEVARGDVSISLTRTEYHLLERLVCRAGRVVLRRLLIESVWGFNREIEESTLDACMRLLRNETRSTAQAKPNSSIRFGALAT